MNQALGTYLVELRQLRGLSATTLARQSAVSRSSLYNWETGRSTPRLQELEAVLRSLGASAKQKQDALQRLGAPRAQKRLKEIVTASHDLPHGGDLLRAMRLRRGWTQAEAASLLKVSQPTVARWERADAWPTPVVLQEICYTLQAHEREVAALTQGHQVFATSLSGKDALQTPEELDISLKAIDNQLETPEGYALADLQYLGLTAQAVPVLQEKKWGQLQLAWILVRHAAYLSLRCQSAEAGRISEQILRLLPNGSEFTKDHRWYYIALSAEIYWANWKYPVKEQARVLEHWLDSPLDDKSQSWLTSQLGTSLLAQGEVEAALEMMERSVRYISRSSARPSEVQRRRNDHAEVLLQAGQPESAAEMLRSMEDMKPPTRIRTKVSLSRANLKTGNRTIARDWLQKAHDENATVSITYYQNEIDELAARL